MFGSATSLRAGKPWIYGTVGNTEILSEVSPHRTQKIAREHFLYPEVIALFLEGVNEFEPPPTLLIIVKEDNDVGDFLPIEYRGLPVTSEYYPGRFIDQAVISFRSFDRVHSHNRYRHNYAHRILEQFGYPVWFMEGLTEVLSTMEIKRNTTQVGLIQDHQIDRIRQAGLIPFEQFFQHFPEHGPDDYRVTDRYYEQAMLLTHYFLFGATPEERTVFFQFLNGDFSYNGSEAEFEETFGYDYGELQVRLESYISNKTYPFLTLHVKDYLQWTGPQFQELSPLREQALTARAYIAARHLDRAYFGINALLQEGVHDPLIYRSAFFLYYHWDEEERAIRMAETALEQDCRNTDFLNAVQAHQPAILTGQASSATPPY